jgi:hypothetical protein
MLLQLAVQGDQVVVATLVAQEHLGRVTTVVLLLSPIVTHSEGVAAARVLRVLLVAGERALRG